MSKLTDAQKRAVKLLKEGNAVASDNGPWWVIGRGTIGRSTMDALKKMGIVEARQVEYRRYIARPVKEV